MNHFDKFILHKPKTINFGKFKPKSIKSIDEYPRISARERIDEILAEPDAGITIIDGGIKAIQKSQHNYIIEQCVKVNVDPDVVEKQQRRINQLELELFEIKRLLSPRRPYKDSHCIYPLVKCPRCTGYINEYTRLGYCPKCGQAIDWGEGDKENV